MKITVSSVGEFNDTTNWLKSMFERTPSTAMKLMAAEGTASLKQHTPRDTGETASGWVADIHIGLINSHIYWNNIAHPHAGVNIAKIIELGHGTGTGGYVPPTPYIKQAMNPVWNNTVDSMIRELTK